MKDLKVSFKSPVNPSNAAQKWDIVRKNLSKIASGMAQKTNLNEIEETKPAKGKSHEANFSEFSEEISISEFSITPSYDKIIKPLKLVPDKRRSSRLYDDYIQQYMKETKDARDLRRKLHLPFSNNTPETTRTRWNFFELSRLKLIERPEPVYPKYQPTYQLGPKIKFNSTIAENIIQDLLDTFLSIVNVNQVMSSQSTIKSSIDHFCTQSELTFNNYSIRVFNFLYLVKSRIKSIADNRYKLIGI